MFASGKLLKAGWLLKWSSEASVSVFKKSKHSAESNKQAANMFKGIHKIGLVWRKSLSRCFNAGQLDQTKFVVWRGLVTSTWEACEHKFVRLPAWMLKKTLPPNSAINSYIFDTKIEKRK